MVATESDNGSFWTIGTFYGWFVVVMVGDGFGYTFTSEEH